MTGHLSVGYSIRGLLQAKRLEVDANAAVWDDEVRVHGALYPASSLTEKRGSLVKGDSG